MLHNLCLCEVIPELGSGDGDELGWCSDVLSDNSPSSYFSAFNFACSSTWRTVSSKTVLCFKFFIIIFPVAVFGLSRISKGY